MRNLRAFLGQLPLSKQLTTIDCELTLEQGINDLQLQQLDKDKVRDWYKKLEFKTWLRQLDGNEGSDTVDAEPRTKRN